jgi:hypothetical protein
LQDRRCLTFLDRLHEHLRQAEAQAALRQALVHLGWLCRQRPRSGQGPPAAHLAEPLQRVVCAKRAANRQAAYRRVAEALRQAVRASSNGASVMNPCYRLGHATEKKTPPPGNGPLGRRTVTNAVKRRLGAADRTVDKRR